MKKRALILMAGLAACSMSVISAEINYAYGIYGSQSAAPLQVFDNGKRLYLQMPPRMLNSPPVPFSEDGSPVEYVIQAPYIVLPLMDRVVLRYGNTKTFVQSAPRAASHVKSSNGVIGANVWYGAAAPASVTSAARAPISVAEAQRAVVAKPAAIVDAPAASPLPTRSFAVSVPPKVAPAAITGRFMVAAAQQQVEAPAARVVFSQPTKAAEKKPEILFAINDGLSMADKASIEGSKAIEIQADGTSAGYRKARDVKRTMPDKNVQLKATGAPIGFVRIFAGV